MRKSIISTAALASVTLFALLHTGPAVAKPMNSCQAKHTSCSERCIMNNPGSSSDTANDGVSRCLKRTCDHQLQNCMRNEAGGSGDGGGKSGPIVRDKRRPRGANLTGPTAGSTPQVQPRPATGVVSGANGGGQKVVRDHRAR